MEYANPKGPRDSTRIVLTPPTFSPPPEMRAAYLNRRKGEVPDLLGHARAGEWKPVITVTHHVRGTGAMYGFPDVGKAADALTRAVQNGDADLLDFMNAYAEAVAAAAV